MSTLQARLDRIKASFLEKAPEEAKAIMARATQDLSDSGILTTIPAIGNELPPFELPDTTGTVVRSEDLLKKGPLVVSVYRGVW
jgi:hypothetical protein